MELFILVLSVLFFLSLAMCSSKKPKRNMRKSPVIELKSISDTNSNADQIKESRNSFVEATSKIGEPLNEFLLKAFSENNIDEKVLELVLTSFDKWLNCQKNPESEFATVIKLHDPEMEPDNLENPADDTIRTKRLVKLGKLANKFGLSKILIALIHPKNIQHDPQMCSIISATSHYMDFVTKTGYSNFIYSFEAANCITKINTFITESSLTILKLMHAKKHPIFARGLAELTKLFIGTNDVEKLEFLISAIVPNRYIVTQEAMEYACLCGSYKLLDTIVKYQLEPSQDAKQSYANKSFNKETLEWVYRKFAILPDQDSIGGLCEAGKSDIIQRVYFFSPDLLRNKLFIKKAVENNQIELLKWFIDNFLDLVDPNDLIGHEISLEIFNTIESKFEICSDIFTSDKFFNAMRCNQMEFLRLAIKFNSNIINQLPENPTFIKTIEIVVANGHLQILELIYEHFKVDLFCFFKIALENGQIITLKWMMRKLDDIDRENITDLELIEYCSKKELLKNFTFGKYGLCNIVVSGNVVVLKEFMHLFPKLRPQNYIKDAIKNGHSEMVEFLFNLPRPILPLPYSILGALVNGHGETIKSIICNQNIDDESWKKQVRTILLENMIPKGISGAQIKEIKKLLRDSKW